MTYREMQSAEAEYLKAVESKPARKQRGATKAALAHRARTLGPCVYCTLPLASHTTAQLLDCANARI